MSPSLGTESKTCAKLGFYNGMTFIPGNSGGDAITPTVVNGVNNEKGGLSLITGWCCITINTMAEESGWN